ncbi:MAG: GFA family protein [Alphaproteobacteria bacterium]|nr:GFA family protein [Alphaproteobacteria bacterium]
MTSIDGGCQCGAVRYAVSVEKITGYACHCLECQKQSASAFGLSVPVPARHFRVDGAMKVYRRPTDSGAETDCWFCETCGTRLYHQGADETDYVTIKGGSLDRPALLNPIAHIWVKRKQPWVLLPPDVPAHPTQPDDLDAWRESLMSSAD